MKRLATILVTSVTLTALVLPARIATARELHVTTTIQAAVDAAHPGDTILVPRGTYRENVVVTKNHLSIDGAAGAVLDGTGLPEGTGIHVWPGANGAGVKDFQLSGLRIQNFSENGVLLEQTSDFRVRRGRYAGNGEYGIFALHSSAGLIEDNDVSGSNDTGIYVGQSADVRVLENVSRDCTVGIEVENSSRILVRDNLATGNSVGILVDVLPGKDVTATEDVVVTENLLVGNNRPNPATDPTDILSRLPSGVGLLNVGGDRLAARQNQVLRNNSAGILVAQLPPDAAALDPRIDPFPDRNEIRINVALQNGNHPDPKLLEVGLQGADLIWDFSGTGDCWQANVFQTVFPGPLPACR